MGLCLWAAASPLGDRVCPLLCHTHMRHLAETSSGRDQGGSPVTSEEAGIVQPCGPKSETLEPTLEHPPASSHAPLGSFWFLESMSRTVPSMRTL